MLIAHTVLWIATLLLPFFVAAHGENATIGARAAGTFTNPLRKVDGSDPFIVYSEGFYYLMTTTWKDVSLTRAKTLEGLKKGETKVVFRSTDPNLCCNFWAPGQFPCHPSII